MRNRDKTLKNSIIAVIAQVITLLLQFVNRRVFVMFLDIEYLGYQTLFTNIFSLLSVAELGIGNVICYQLYKEIVTDNHNEIGKLMTLYKWMYRAVAAFVLVAGGICYFFLPYIVTDATASWSYLRIIYILQLASVVLGYFLSYKRTIYTACQQEYKCVEVDLYVTAVVQGLQLILLALLHNYLVYLCLNLSTTIVANIIISRKVNQEFPYLKKKYSVSLNDVRKRNIFADLKDLLIHKIAYAIYGGTDNIIISAICGIRYVALYGNYVTVYKGIQQVLFYKLLNPVQATIGNIVYSDRKKNELWKQFEMLDVFSFFFATYIGVGFLVLFQPFIQLWMGKEYLLPISFVVLYSITIYISASFEIVYKYRSVFGDYKQDRNCMVISAILNIIISIIGARFLGISGVQLGTLIALLPIVYGRIRFVVKNYFEQSISKYLIKHVIYFVISAGIAVISYRISLLLPVSIIGFCGCVGIVIVIPTVIGVAFFHRNEAFRDLVQYLVTMIKDVFSYMHI